MAEVRRYVPLPRKRPLTINGQPSLEAEPEVPETKVIPFNPMAEPAQVTPPAPDPAIRDQLNAEIARVSQLTRGSAPAPAPPPADTIAAEPSPVDDVPVIDYNGMILPNNDTTRGMIEQSNKDRTGQQTDESDNWAKTVTDYEYEAATEKARQTKATQQAELAKSHERAFQMAPENEKWWGDTYAAAPDYLKPVIGSLAVAERESEHLVTNAASGLAQIPGDVAGAVNLAGALGGGAYDVITDKYGTDPLTGKPVPLSFWDKVGTSFQRRMFAEGGYDRLSEKMMNLAKEYLGADQSMSTEDAMTKASEWLDTDEGYQFYVSQLAPGFQMQQQSNWWANGMAGVGLRPDQQTIFDDLEQIGAQSLFGLPKFAVKAMEKGAIKFAGEQFVKNKAVRMATKALEIATPITMPYTPGNVAANAAFSAVITEVVRDLGKQPSFINGPDPDVAAEVLKMNAQITARGGPDKLTPEETAAVEARGVEMTDQLRKQADISPPDGQGVNIDGQIDQEFFGMGALTLGAIFSMPAFMRSASKTAAEDAIKGLNRGTIDVAARAAGEGITGGPTIKEQGGGRGNLDPLLGTETPLGRVTITGTASSAASMSAGIRKTQTAKAFEDQFGYAPTDADLAAWHDKTYVDVELQMAASTRAGRLEAESDLVQRGILDNHTPTISSVDMQRAAQEMEKRTPGKYNNTFREYAFASQRLQNEKTTLNSLAQDISDVRKRIVELRSGAKMSDTLALEKEFADLRQRHYELETDQPHTRSMLEQASSDELRKIVREAERDPEIKALQRMTQKHNEDVADFGVTSGLFSKEVADEFKSNRPWYIPINEAELAGSPSLVKRSQVWARKLGIGEEPTQSSYLTPRPQSREALAAKNLGVVNEPKDPLIALMEHSTEIVRDATINNTRRSIVDTMEGISGAKGVLFKPLTFKKGKGTTEWLTDGEVGIHKSKILATPNVFMYKDKGLTRVIQMSDEGMGSAMQFASQAVVPFLNATRTLWQRGQTGKFLRPDFALTTAMWSTGQARMNLPKGRSFGVLDTGVRRITGDNKVVGAVMDQIGVLPDQWVSATIGIPKQLAQQAVGKIGKTIADDLMHNSGVIGAIGKTPQGRKVLEAGGRAMYKWYERTTTNIYHQNIPSSSVAVKEAARIGDDYRLASRGNIGNRTVAGLFDMYAAMTDAVRGAAHYAVFSENYGREVARLGGEQPSEEWMKSLRYDIMNLTGDMTRTSGNKGIQRATSIIPYGNSVLQGTSYIASAMVGPNMARGINKLTGGAANLRTYRSNRFWGQLITGAVLPAWGSMALLESWGKEAQDYWYNKKPEWYRASHMLIPNIDSIIHWATHGYQWPKWDEKNVYELPIAPEVSMFLVPTIGAMRAMGMGPPKAGQPAGPLDVMWNAMKQATNFVTPPTLMLAGALSGNGIDMHALLTGDFDSFIQPTFPDTFGGINADMMSSNSIFASRLYEVSGAILGSTGKLIMESLNAGEIAGRYDAKGKPYTNPVDWFMDAGRAAWDTGSYEFMKRVPDVPGLPGMDRNYSYTPESEFVRKTQHTLEPIIGTGRQQSVEADTQDRQAKLRAMGLIAPEDLTSPLLRVMTDQIYGYLKRKGPFTQADKVYTMTNIELNSLQAGRYKYTDTEYHKIYSHLIKKKQKLKAVQSTLITRFDKRWKQTFGNIFQKQNGVPLTFENFVAAAREDIRKQGGK